MKFAILFPGQGSQKVGMGLDLKETKIGKEIFQKIDQISKRAVSNLFLYGPEEELNQTKNTQLAIIGISVTLILILQEKLNNKNLSFNPYACCGHSLGELTALWFSNILSLEDLIKLVITRGNLMQNAPKGSMAAILNLPQEKIEKLLTENDLKNKIVIANYNTPTQFVISGNKEAFINLEQRIKSIGGRTIILPVSGAFHSHLMAAPSKAFSEEIDKLPINSSKIPIYQNYDGKLATDHKTIKDKLKKQMISPVLWTQTINNLVNDGITRTVEIGPGKVLTGLVKKINPNVDCYNIFDLESLQNFITSYEQQLATIKS